MTHTTFPTIQHHKAFVLRNASRGEFELHLMAMFVTDVYLPFLLSPSEEPSTEMEFHKLVLPMHQQWIHEPDGPAPIRLSDEVARPILVGALATCRNNTQQRLLGLALAGGESIWAHLRSLGQSWDARHAAAQAEELVFRRWCESEERTGAARRRRRTVMQVAEAEILAAQGGHLDVPVPDLLFDQDVRVRLSIKAGVPRAAIVYGDWTCPRVCAPGTCSRVVEVLRNDGIVVRMKVATTRGPRRWYGSSVQLVY